MHKNFIWQAFLLIIFLTTLWYTVVAGFRYYAYVRLTQQTALEDIEWHIEEVSEEDYVLTANYKFKIDSQSFSGSTSWTKMPYRNRYSADRAKEERAAQEWRVWFDPSSPEHSSLQKDFPLKESVSATFLWGLLLYFLWLGFYVARFRA